MKDGANKILLFCNNTTALPHHQERALKFGISFYKNYSKFSDKVDAVMCY